MQILMHRWSSPLKPSSRFKFLPAELGRFFGFGQEGAQLRLLLLRDGLPGHWSSAVASRSCGPILLTATEVWCFVCDEGATVLRSRCPVAGCKGNVIHEE